MKSVRRWFGMKSMTRLLALVLILTLPLGVALTLYQDRIPSQSKPYIIQGYSLAKARSAVESTGAEITQVLTIIKAVAARLTINQYDQLSHHSSIRRIYPDLELIASSGSYVKQGKNRDTFYPGEVQADHLHLEGITGDGITIAVVDSGLGHHRALIEDTRGEDRVLASFDVTRTSSWKRSSGDDEDEEDDGFSLDSLWSSSTVFTRSSRSSKHSSKSSKRSSKSYRKFAKDKYGHGSHLTSVMVSSKPSPMAS